MHDNSFGFKIIRPLVLKDWKVLTIDETISFDMQEYCPADTETRLQTFCTLVDNKGIRKIRIGRCADCGYIGYIDRPKEEWMKEFYLSGKWDNGESEKKPQKNIRRIARVELKNFGNNNEIVARVKELDINRDRPVCEIGCGYGESLGLLKQMGFHRLFGVENAPHRAEVASKAIGIDIFRAPFEDKDVQSEFKKHAPFGLIFSSHVLEHTYHPGEIIRCAASLQSEGDYLIISVPYFLGELSMMVIGFLPHLHSFMPSSLERLLNKNGYQALDTKITDGCNMTMVAKKSTNPMPKEQKLLASMAIIQEKFIKGLGMGKNAGSLRRLWWNRKTDIGGQMRYAGNPFLEKLNYALRSWINHLRYKKRIIRWANQSLLIQPLFHRSIPIKESLFEIQFDGQIFLFYK